MDWRTPGILDMPDARERAWLAQVAANVGPAQVARLVLRQAPAGISPGPFPWAVEIGAADLLSASGNPLPDEDEIGPATALIDQIHPGWSWAWIHTAPGVAHVHVIAHRHADALLARLPGRRRRTGKAVGLLAALAAPCRRGSIGWATPAPRKARMRALPPSGWRRAHWAAR